MLLWELRTGADGTLRWIWTFIWCFIGWGKLLARTRQTAGDHRSTICTVHTRIPESQHRQQSRAISPQASPKSIRTRTIFLTIVSSSWIRARCARVVPSLRLHVSIDDDHLVRWPETKSTTRCPRLSLSIDRHCRSYLSNICKRGAKNRTELLKALLLADNWHVKYMWGVTCKCDQWTSLNQLWMNEDW